MDRLHGGRGASGWADAREADARRAALNVQTKSQRRKRSRARLWLRRALVPPLALRPDMVLDFFPIRGVPKMHGSIEFGSQADNGGSIDGRSDRSRCAKQRATARQRTRARNEWRCAT